jgi:hypothetical protein
VLAVVRALRGEVRQQPGAQCRCQRSEHFRTGREQVGDAPIQQPLA